MKKKWKLKAVLDEISSHELCHYLDAFIQKSALEKIPARSPYAKIMAEWAVPGKPLTLAPGDVPWFIHPMLSKKSRRIRVAGHQVSFRAKEMIIDKRKLAQIPGANLCHFWTVISSGELYWPFSKIM